MPKATEYVKIEEITMSDGRTKYTLDGYFDTIEKDTGEAIKAKLPPSIHVFIQDLNMEKIQAQEDIIRRQEDIEDIDLKLAAIAV